MPTFSLGRLLATPNALRRIPPEDIQHSLHRHLACDWGDVVDEDRAANDRALKDGTRLFSVYHSRAKTKFWIITEADRNSTTILLPEDY